MQFLVHSASVSGNRRMVNQDSLGLRVAQTASGPVALAVLCDGMGGLSRGEQASATVTAAFLDWFDCQLPPLLRMGLTPQMMSAQWEGLAKQVNQTLYTYARARQVRMGTTLTAMLLTPIRYFLLSIGDTRAYRITWHLKQLTQDQTLLAQEVPIRRMTIRQIQDDPRASVLLQCIGATRHIEPQVVMGRTVSSATYLLCTDGLYRTVPGEELSRMFRPAALVDPESLQEAVSHALAQNYACPERDDTSVIVIRTR